MRMEIFEKPQRDRLGLPGGAGRELYIPRVSRKSQAHCGPEGLFSWLQDGRTAGTHYERMNVAHPTNQI